MNKSGVYRYIGNYDVDQIEAFVIAGYRNEKPYHYLDSPLGFPIGRLKLLLLRVGHALRCVNVMMMMMMMIMMMMIILTNYTILTFIINIISSIPETIQSKFEISGLYSVVLSIVMMAVVVILLLVFTIMWSLTMKDD